MRTTCLLAGVLVFLLVAAATPAVAGDDPAPAAGKAELQKEIKRLNKDLAKLEKQLDELRATETSTDQHPDHRKILNLIRLRQMRLDDARKRLAAALAAQGETDVARRRAQAARGAARKQRRKGFAELAPYAGRRNPPATDAPRGPRGQGPRGQGPRGQGPRGQGPRGQGPRGPGGAAGRPNDAAPGHATQLLVGLKKMHEAHGRLSARVDALERQIRRLAAAIGKLDGGEGEDRAKKARKRRARRGRAGRRGAGMHAGRRAGGGRGWMREPAMPPGPGGGAMGSARGMGRGAGFGRGMGRGAGFGRGPQPPDACPAGRRMLRLRMLRARAGGERTRRPAAGGACPLCGRGGEG